MWDQLAAFFDMPAAPAADVKLVETMANEGPFWSRIAAAHDLVEPDLDSMVSWGFADYVFGTTWDVMSDAVKIRKAGFWDFVDSEQMLIDRLKQLYTLNIIPNPTKICQRYT